MSQFKIPHRPARYCSTRNGETIPVDARTIGHLPRHKSGRVARLEIWDGNLKHVAADVRGELPGIAGVSNDSYGCVSTSEHEHFFAL